MGKRLDIKSGDGFGRWTIIEQGEPTPLRGRRFWCRCDCGTVSLIQLTHLRQGVSKSCGCLSREIAIERATKHGHAGEPLYQVWSDMTRRCFNPNHRRFKDWGGRGITVCDEWRDLEAFLAWANNSGYRSGLLIERKDNNGNYEPGNCCWTTMKEQGNNRRNNRRITHNGQTLTQTQWADLIGMTLDGLRFRLKNWPLDKALETPPDDRHRRRAAS